MGRKLKYKTYEDQLEAKRRWRREYYNRNKEWINEEYMRKYYEKRDQKISIVCEKSKNDT